MLVRIYNEKHVSGRPQIRKTKDGYWTIYYNWMPETPIKVKKKHQINKILKKLITDQEK